MYGDVADTGIDVCVYPNRCHVCTWIQSPSIHLYLCVCVYGHLSIFRYVYFGAASRRACGRAVIASAPAWVASASGYNHRSERIGVCITRNAGVCACMRGLLSMASARSSPRPSIVARRARAARARGARQAHRKHEGEGAPRVARQVHALVLIVRPRRALGRFARSRRCWRCAAARGAAAPCAGPHHAALDAAAAALPVARPAAEPRARTAGARGRPARGQGWAGAARRGRTVGAQDRGQHRARGAAGGGRVAEPEGTVSAPDRRVPTARPSVPRTACGRAARALDVHH